MLQDSGASQQNGGNLIFSTTGSAAGATVTDRLTIDSSGLASFSASLTVASSSSTLTANGNTVLGTGSTNTLIVNAAAQINAAVAAAGPLSVAGVFFASGSSTLGTSNSNTLIVNAAATFNAAVTYGNALTVAGLLAASGNTILGTTGSNTLTVNAATTFNAGVDLFGSSGTAATAPTMSYWRQYPSAAATATNAVVGSAVYSRWDGSAYKTTAQIRSVYTVCSLCHAENMIHAGFSCREALRWTQPSLARAILRRAGKSLVPALTMQLALVAAACSHTF